MRTVAIIQARIGSTRLPGKVLLDLAGQPMLSRCINRIQRAETISDVIVATTDQPADNNIVELCEENGWLVFRGSEMDLLDRYYQAAVSYQAGAVVRITSDCPLIEPQLIDQVVNRFWEQQPVVEYGSNIFPKRTFPRGLDLEVIRFDVLEQLWHDDQNLAWREHVTPYIHHNPEMFAIDNLCNEIDYSNLRWTVDTSEDFALIEKIYHHFGHDQFEWTEVLTLLKLYPEWLKINQHIQQKVL